MSTLNYTTKVPAERTIAEIQRLLARQGASAISTMYENASPVGLTFMLPTVHGPRVFTLPVDVDAARRVLIAENKNGFGSSGKRNANYTTAEHAARVAWRVLKDWLEAQLALIGWEMAAFDQVMLPYIHADGQRTLYELYKDREQLALGVGADG